MTVRLRAPAKINLTLHITGQRDDGYHLLESLVAFGPAYDVVQVSPADENSLQISGPEAAGLSAGDDNLILRAAGLLNLGAGQFHLEKHLPVASGIGGGSSDAAAALRGLLLAYGADRGQADILQGKAAEILALGADVPMCLWSQSLRAAGIGEKITAVDLPPMACVLVNPRVQVSTPAVFKSLTSKTNPAMPADIPSFRNAVHCISWLAEQRNDLQPPALALVPEIEQVLAALLGKSGCGLARMSGSGATCFGLFPDLDQAEQAAAAIRADHSGWWVSVGMIADGRDWSEPIK